MRVRPAVAGGTGIPDERFVALESRAPDDAIVAATFVAVHLETRNMGGREEDIEGAILNIIYLH